MKVSSLSHIKKELATLPQEELVNICLRLAKYKKENKELIHYLLFEVIDEEQYIQSVKEILAELFQDINSTSWYLAKKTIRKILRLIQKYVKYSGKTETEIELRLFFCLEFQQTLLPKSRSTVVKNIYVKQVVTLEKLMLKIHEDLQFDYTEDLHKVKQFVIVL